MRVIHLFGLLAFVLCGVFVQAADRPNIVFLFSDDHAYQALSCYPRPLALNETPNLDRAGSNSGTGSGRSMGLAESAGILRRRGLGHARQGPPAIAARSLAADAIPAGGATVVREQRR